MRALEQNAVVPEVVIWIGSEALPVEANTQPCSDIPSALSKFAKLAQCTPWPKRVSAAVSPLGNAGGRRGFNSRADLGSCCRAGIVSSLNRPWTSPAHVDLPKRSGFTRFLKVSAAPTQLKSSTFRISLRGDEPRPASLCGCLETSQPETWSARRRDRDWLFLLEIVRHLEYFLRGEICLRRATVRAVPHHHDVVAHLLDRNGLSAYRASRIRHETYLPFVAHSVRHLYRLYTRRTCDGRHIKVAPSATRWSRRHLPWQRSHAGVLARG